MPSTAAGTPTGRVSCSARPDGKPIHPEYITRTFDRLVAKHGLPRIRFHDVRHTHATLAAEGWCPGEGCQPNASATPAAGFTLNVYQHVLPGMQAEAAQIFDDLLDGAWSDPDAGL